MYQLFVYQFSGIKPCLLPCCGLLSTQLVSSRRDSDSRNWNLSLMERSYSSAHKRLIVIDIQPIAIIIQLNAIDIQPIAIDIQPIAIDIQPNAIIIQPIAIDIQPNAIIIQPIAINIRPT